jgi:pSer/pThr/pTyr-binding forkhead associated (FHA) protein
MPLLESGVERFALQPGTYVLGGRGPNALPLASLDCSPEVATIVVPPSGASTIQRLTASIVVRLDQTAIGIAPKALPDGVEIEFNGCRLTFMSDDAGEASVTSGSSEGEADDGHVTLEPFEPPAVSVAPAKTARVVNVRTGDAIDLGNTRVVVGRGETCDLIVPGMDVSRRHCSITPVQGGYLLRDESANGTLVNGSRVSGTYLLGHGDIVRVAEEDLRFEVDGAPDPAQNTTAAATAVLDVSRLRAEYASAKTAEHPGTPLVANLEIVRGPFAGASFSLDRPVCSIGRSVECDVRIRDESISSNHATLLRKGSSWFVVDLRSANGTFVDGSRIAGERELTLGSRLKLGRVELMFRALDGGAENATAAKRTRWWFFEWVAPLFSRKLEAVAEDTE